MHVQQHFDGSLFSAVGNLILVFDFFKDIDDTVLCDAIIFL